MALYTLIVTFVAAFLHGLIGFGFPMIATPLLSFAYGVKLSVILSIVPTFAVNLAMILLSKRGYILALRYIPLFVFISIGSFVGTKILLFYPSEIYKIILAAIIFLYLYNTKGAKRVKFLKNKSRAFLCMYGLFCGIVSGIVNVMIPVLVIYLKENLISKKQMIVVMNCCFLSSKIVQIATFGFSGAFSAELVNLIFISIIIAFLALFVGLNFSKKIDSIFYTKILNYSLFVMAFLLVFDAILNII